MSQAPSLRYATLSLGNRSDARAWEEGCRSLGLKQAYSCIKPVATSDDVMAFLGTGADWVFMAGHSGGDDLYGESTKPLLNFSRDAIIVFDSYRGRSRTLRINDPAFGMRPLQLIVFAGCAPFTQYGGCAPILRTLFGNAAVLGTSSLTGPEMVKTMFGGMGSAQGFFGNCRANGMDPVKAWLAAAAAIYGGGQPMPHKTISVEDNFRALDASGQHWKIQGKQIVKANPIQ